MNNITLHVRPTNKKKGVINFIYNRVNEVLNMPLSDVEKISAVRALFGSYAVIDEYGLEIKSNSLFTENVNNNIDFFTKQKILENDVKNNFEFLKLVDIKYSYNEVKNKIDVLEESEGNTKEEIKEQIRNFCHDLRLSNAENYLLNIEPVEFKVCSPFYDLYIALREKNKKYIEKTKEYVAYYLINGILKFDVELNDKSTLQKVRIEQVIGTLGTIQSLSGRDAEKYRIEEDDTITVKNSKKPILKPFKGKEAEKYRIEEDGTITVKNSEKPIFKPINCMKCKSGSYKMKLTERQAEDISKILELAHIPDDLDIYLKSKGYYINASALVFKYLNTMSLLCNIISRYEFNNRYIPEIESDSLSVDGNIIISANNEIIDAICTDNTVIDEVDASDESNLSLYRHIYDDLISEESSIITDLTLYSLNEDPYSPEPYLQIDFLSYKYREKDIQFIFTLLDRNSLIDEDFI